MKNEEKIIALIDNKIAKFDSIKKALIVAGINYKLGPSELKRLHKKEMLVIGKQHMPILLNYSYAEKEIKSKYKEYLYNKEIMRTKILKNRYNILVNNEHRLKKYEIFVLNKNLTVKKRFIGGPMEFARKYNLLPGTVKSYLSRGKMRNKISDRGNMLYCYASDYNEYVKNKKPC